MFVFRQSSRPSLCLASASPFSSMALRDACAAWLAAPEGRLCAWQQARALAFREASAEIHGAPWASWQKKKKSSKMREEHVGVAGVSQP